MLRGMAEAALAALTVGMALLMRRMCVAYYCRGMDDALEMVISIMEDGEVTWDE